MDTVAHLLITRFNLSINKELSQRAAIKGIDRFDESYLLHRVGLFEQITVPSIAQQTTGDFSWIVLIDSQSPPWLSKRISKIARTMELVGELDDSILYQRLASENFVRSDKPVLTTRIDNDDAVAPNFLRDIQSANRNVVDNGDRIFFNFASGEKHYLVGGARLAARSMTSPFITLRSNKPETVYRFRHNEIGTEGTIIQLPGERQWIRSIHPSNLTGPFAVTPWNSTHVDP